MTDFLDHLLRETPSHNPQFTAVKRSFFAPGSSRVSLGGGVDAFRGVYQSIRIVHVSPLPLESPRQSGS